MSEDKNKVGRPSDYSKELAIKICEKLADGWPLTQIVKMDGMPCLATIYLWFTQPEKKEFLDMYVRAREDQADTLADEIISIADDSENDNMIIKKDGKETVVEDKEWVNRSKLRVDARKWVASKLKPRKYADKIDIDQKISGVLKFDVKFNDNPDNLPT